MRSARSREELRVVIGDGVVAEAAEEGRVRHPHGEAVQVAEHRREVVRGFDDAVVDAARENGDVLVGDFADEKVRNELGVVVLDRRSDERIVEDDALAVARVLRERGAAFEDAAAEDAARGVEAVVLFVAFGAEPLEDVEEARAVLGLVDGEDAIVELLGAPRGAPEGENLDERGEASSFGFGAAASLASCSLRASSSSARATSASIVPVRILAYIFQSLMASPPRRVKKDEYAIQIARPLRSRNIGGR